MVSLGQKAKQTGVEVLCLKLFQNVILTLAVCSVKNSTFFFLKVRVIFILLNSSSIEKIRGNDFILSTSKAELELT